MRYNKLAFVSFSFFSIFILSACGGLKLGGGLGGDTKVIRSFSFDGVKLIQKGIDNGYDTHTYQQTMYNVAETSRLLIRFNALKNSKNEIRLDAGDDVWVRLTINDFEDVEGALKQLKLCPMARGDWNMISTWVYANSFAIGNEGRWRKVGGDYDADNCVSPQNDLKTDPDTGSAPDDHSLYFKVTRWFRDYVIGRNVNYGHILVNSGSSLAIYGDQSGSFSPRIIWTE